MQSLKQKFEKWFNEFSPMEMEMMEPNLILDFFLSEQKQRDERIMEAVEEIGHQQEDDTIWCNMDKILQIIKTIE